MKKILTVLVLAGSVWATQVTADDASTADDVRCFAVSLMIVGSQNATAQSAGLVSAMYWMGRLDGRVPDTELEDMLIGQIKKMKTEDYQAEARRCGATLSTKGKFMTDLGHDMEQKGMQMQQLQNSR